MSWYTVAIATMMYGIAFLDRQVLSFMVGPIRADLKISDFELSLLHGAGFAVFYAIFALPIGILVDRYSRRVLMCGGVAIWSVATAACGLAQSFFQLFFARMIVGAGEAVVNPCANSMISDVFPKRGVTLALAVFTCGAAVGSAISVTAVGYLISATAHLDVVNVPLLGPMKPWRMIFMVVGLPGLLLALLNFTFPEPRRRGKASTTTPPLPAVLHFMKTRRGFFVCHFLGYSLIQIASYCTYSWVPTYMIRHFHWEVSQVALAVSGMTLCSIPLSASLGWFINRRYDAGHTDAHLSMYAVAILVCAPIIIAAAILAPTPSVAVVLFAVGLGPLAYIGIAGAAMQVMTPNEFRGQVSVMFMFVMTCLGIGLGPSVPALFTDFLFHDDNMVGSSMALTVAITAPLAAIFLWSGRSYMRKAVAEAQAWSSN
jgi:MFS family permease